MQVTTASKKAQSLNVVPAAIFVVTAEDIKRIGAKNVPEALRMVPGVQVSRLGGETYAVSVRGFNSYNSNKLLVLVDGRTIYSPYISGTYWEATDMLMENIERIEVIRGPGGSLWGANAVDGIINIITKSSKDTQGGLFIASAGSLELNRLAFRYGGQLGANGTYRVDGKAGVNKDAELADGTRTGDGENLAELGFRADFDEKSKGRFMIQGSENRFGLYEATYAPLPAAPYSTFYGGMEMVTASHLLGRWEHDEANGAQTAIQAYYNMLDYPFSYQGLSGYTFDLDVQHQMAQMKNQSITVGFGARSEINNTWKGIAGWLYPADQRDTILSAFGQDEITLNPTNHLTLGLKYEHNSVTGSEFQPNARYAYTPDENHTIWASVARAVRKPGQFDSGQVDFASVTAPTGGGLPSATVIYGNQSLNSERLIANEIGYRTKPVEKVIVDVAGFYNIYDNLLYTSQGTPFTGTVLGSDVGSVYPISGQQYNITPIYTYNGDKGHTYGIELATHYNPSKTFRATLGYSYLNYDGFNQGTALNTPRSILDLHLSWDLPHELKFDTMAYYYDAIFDESVPAYMKLDMSLSWKPTARYELSVGGNDLLSDRHQEGVGIFWPTSQIPRSYYAKVTVHF